MTLCIKYSCKDERYKNKKLDIYQNEIFKFANIIAVIPTDDFLPHDELCRYANKLRLREILLHVKPVLLQKNSNLYLKI